MKELHEFSPAIRIAAVHEAGHAAVMLRLRLPLEKVVLRVNAQWCGGFVLPAPSSFSVRGLLEDANGCFRSATATEMAKMKEAKERALARKQLVVYFAGMAAEREIFPRLSEEIIQNDGRRDLADAMRIARNVFNIPLKSIPSFLAEFDQKARTLVGDLSLKIVVLGIARELANRGHLTPEQCRAEYKYFAEEKRLKRMFDRFDRMYPSAERAA